MGNAGVPTVRKKVLIFLRKDSGGLWQGKDILDFWLDFCLFICIWVWFFSLMVLFEIMKIMLQNLGHVIMKITDLSDY